MHISDGILSAPVWIGGYVGTAAVAAATLRKIDIEEIPKISVLTAVFFVADLVHVPAGPTSVHLILNGLVGVVLGFRAFPAILLGVILQAILLGHGGPTVIGVNTLMLGGGALVGYGVWQLRHMVRFGRREVVFGALAGAAAIAASGLIMASALLLTGKEFVTQAKLVLAAHAIIMVLEAIVVGAAAGFLAKVRPDALAGHRVAPPGPATVGPVLAALAVGAALLMPHPAQAHKLIVDYTALKEGLLVEAFFPDGRPAQEIGIRLMTPTGDVVEAGTTNKQGGYLFAVPERADYVTDADAGMGHFAELEIPASALDGIEFGHEPEVSAAEVEKSVTKVHREAFPVKKVAIAFGLLAVVGGGAMWLSRRRRHAA